MADNRKNLGHENSIPHRFYCQISSHGKTKATYDNLELAWMACFELFIKFGHLLTPYKCHRHHAYRAQVNYGPNKNPWSWIPMGKFKLRMIRTSRKRPPCGGYHLTSGAAHQLNP